VFERENNKKTETDKRMQEV